MEAAFSGQEIVDREAEEGTEVEAVDRSGAIVCQAKVVKVLTSKNLDRTPVITIEVPKNMVNEVRGIKRARKRENND